jgi:hypothetical protein
MAKKIERKVKEPGRRTMTKSQRKILHTLGPYTLREDGAILDYNGFSLAYTRPTSAAEETEWDRALVAAINAVWAEEQRRTAEKSKTTSKRVKAPRCTSRDAVGCQCVLSSRHKCDHTSNKGDTRFSWPRGRQ